MLIVVLVFSFNFLDIYKLKVWKFYMYIIENFDFFVGKNVFKLWIINILFNIINLE